MGLFTFDWGLVLVANEFLTDEAASGIKKLLPVYLVAKLLFTVFYYVAKESGGFECVRYG